MIHEKLQAGSSKVSVSTLIVILAQLQRAAGRVAGMRSGSELEGEDDEESSSRNGMWS